MKLHVILVNYTAPLEQIEAVTPAHRAWLDEHYHSGLFITSGPRDPRTGGVIVAAGDKEQLQELLKQDPFSVAGLAEYDIIAFTPVKRGQVLALGGVPLVE